MSAHAPAPSERPAGGAPQTKFRAPRVRHDTVARAPLLARLVRSVEVNPVTVVCAPAGSGKTTLLAQLAADASHGMTVLWVALDGDDNSANRLFLALVQAVEPLGLTWESDPRSLGAGLTGPGPQTRAALAALVNALCTSPARRIVFVFDDLHRLGGRDIGELTEALVERLPDHVALVLGSRVEPHLPLARWRAHGELGEFGPQDLQFTETDAIALALARFGAVPNERELRDSLARTHGWAVGMSLMLQARGSGSAERASSLAAGSSDRHLFAYLAQEILAELPPALRDFILRSSILAELSPTLCEAVTGRSDCVAVLESLYRRNLFLTSIDETTPVLRFHDLFRDFLQDRLQREQPQLVPQLHDAAGRAESVPARAIHHFLEGGNWKEAAARILQNGERLLLEGAITTLERWIDAIPAEERAQMPALGYLRGACAWLRWDWPRVKREMTPAVAGLTDPSQIGLHVRALFGLVDALSSSGEQQLAWDYLEAASRIPLDHLGRAHLSLQRGWSLTHSGSYEQLPQLMHEFIEHMQHDPVAICPSTAPRVHCLMIGLPGVADAFERLRDINENLRGATPGPWQIAAAVVGGWAHLWRGNREGAGAGLGARRGLSTPVRRHPRRRRASRSVQGSAQRGAGECRARASSSLVTTRKGSTSRSSRRTLPRGADRTATASRACSGSPATSTHTSRSCRNSCAREIRSSGRFSIPRRTRRAASVHCWKKIGPRRRPPSSARWSLIRAPACRWCMPIRDSVLRTRIWLRAGRRKRGLSSSPCCASWPTRTPSECCCSSQRA